ncbi:hypothetical protein GWI33_023118, partial [Rhynchophorus ferrugineus]
FTITSSKRNVKCVTAGPPQQGTNDERQARLKKNTVGREKKLPVKRTNPWRRVISGNLTDPEEEVSSAEPSSFRGRHFCAQTNLEGVLGCADSLMGGQG